MQNSHVVFKQKQVVYGEEKGFGFSFLVCKVICFQISGNRKYMNIKKIGKTNKVFCCENNVAGNLELVNFRLVRSCQ